MTIKTSITHDGKELSTYKDLREWYLNKVAEHKRTDPGFNERKFSEAEEKLIRPFINELNPTDTKTRSFKKDLFEYLIRIIYDSQHPPMYPVRLPQDIFMDFKSWFN